MTRLEGKIAVVTGGATGIGLAAARRFIEEGAFVYIFGRRQEKLDAALAQLGDKARAVRGSVADLADLDRLFDTVKAEQGRLDILLANAGTGEFAALDEITPDHYDRTFDVNVKGLLFTVQKGLPLMASGGSIILTGSSTSVMGTPRFSVYSATKAAIRNFARSWAQDLRGTGIRVNVLSPGPTMTELAIEVVGEEAFKELGAGTPIGHVGDPAEIAAVAAFLASSDSSFMTGSEVFADGGLAQI
jgi:NAD(P)-dependent dehydrogenase (short-subunit alcohol dehydrogenase family)